MANKPIVYMDSCCFIDVAKQAVGNLPTERDNDVWHIKKLLEAHRAADIIVYTSVLSIAECVATESGQANVPEDVQARFRNLLVNGQYVTLAQPTPRTGQIACDIRWNDHLVLSGADAMHIATALEIHADEMITSDGRLMAGVAAHFAGNGRLRIISASDTACLPSRYRQGDMLNA